MSEANKALVRRAIKECLNQRNMSVIAELYTDCVYRSPAVGELRGEEYRQFLASVTAAFSDGQWTVEDQLVEGDKVATRSSFIGTH